MKQKRVFLSIWIILLTVLSVIICTFYQSTKADKESMHQSIQENLNDDLFLYGVSITSALSDSQEYPKFNDLLIKNQYAQGYTDLIKRTYSFYSNDENIQYCMYDTDSKKLLVSNRNEETFTKNNSSFFGKIKFKKDGTIELFDDFANLKTDSNQLLDYMRHYLYEEGYNEDTAKASITFPRNYEVMIRIPDELAENGMRVYDTIYDSYQFAPYAIISMVIGASILALFILLYPIEIVAQCQPFKFFKSVKFEINFIIACFALTFGCAGVVMLASFTMNGEIGRLFHIAGIWEEVSVFVNIAAWMLLFAYMSVVFYICKHIFANGFGRFLKQDTIVGGIIRRFKRYMNGLADVELTHANQSLIKLLLLNLAIIVVLCTMWGFGIFFAFIYTIAIFFWLRKKLDAICLEYQELLENAKAMEEGNFDYEYQHTDGMFKELQYELTQVRTGFEKAVEEETKSQMMKTELISNVSHDLKTPLTGMRNYIELLQEPELDEETRNQYMQMVAQYSERLSQLIEDLFEVSKVNSGNIQLNLMELDLKALIEQAQAECSDILEEKHLQVLTNFDAEQYIVVLDGDKTMRIFENLFINIGKYALENTRVYVDAKVIANHVCVTLKNISAAPLNFDEDTIIERFQRGDSSRHGEGSGLGLAIVKSFTEVQKGSFHIEIDGDLFKAIIRFPIKPMDSRE